MACGILFPQTEMEPDNKENNSLKLGHFKIRLCGTKQNQPWNIKEVVFGYKRNIV